ncbi:hypothetical protein [Autumnicola psychrophila]|uniref:Uncharacterized protein n=1 Tax=Autumnicola psychrophila TaxID=3075592 RepID=A0ABU3DW20_9FLAO|nr:hypothetical protein [Zunongwangia sp. F225]MDT0687909.1 hypothetical protein [Zunongwangia sp. F225]
MLNFYNIRIFQFLILLTLLLSSCVDSERNEDSNIIDGQIQNNSEEKSTQDIKQRVAAINIETVPYIFNNKKVALLERKLESAGGNEKLNLLLTYGLELLNAGNTEESIAVLD